MIDVDGFCPTDLSKAQRTLSNTLTQFEFKCIGSDEQTDDERIIGKFKFFEMFQNVIIIIVIIFVHC